MKKTKVKKAKEISTRVDLRFTHEIEHCIPACGWLPNYCDITLDDRRKGTLVFANGTLGLYVEGHTFTLNLMPLVDEMVKEAK